ncbi:hypothetical protein BBAL3_1938 [Brevundimonas sp. BAL3]|nr:hypothetical protein BBAL3_1938 [Brevundimonas sp. BAL3]
MKHSGPARRQREGDVLSMAPSSRAMSSAARSFARWLEVAGFETGADGAAGAV